MIGFQVGGTATPASGFTALNSLSSTVTDEYKITGTVGSTIAAPWTAASSKWIGFVSSFASGLPPRTQWQMSGNCRVHPASPRNNL